MFLTRGADVVMIVCCSVIDKYSAAASYRHVAISATSWHPYCSENKAAPPRFPPKIVILKQQNSEK